ncbi:hypothetical protein AHMF7605_22585 [Adhaeribacter arboris]|uniref:Terminase n=1 Tax=Adhaeribacter arboris TaxID=2072846 RepID=A0A2T2YKS3_9BACT|nr:phage terminase large subunit [Adhaeribacter arboris]PSR56089.1 hypothetical protein AHMF7605_22585 [Adhaeribacter arboris]
MIEEVEFDPAKERVAKFACLDSTLFFTAYFFKKQYNRKFVIGKHHELITQKLDAVLRGEITRLIINIGPRYGKTELAVKSFIANGLALNPASKYIHLSYSDDLALDNSETVRDLVQQDFYKKMFPQVQIKKESNSKKKWYTTAGGGVYATAAAGQVTGFGAGIVDDEEQENNEVEIDNFLTDIEQKQGFGGALIIDDPTKPVDADSETIRERVNQRFDSTISNRVNSRNTPIIIIMQRLHEWDLCGYLMENEPGVWDVLSLPAIQEDEHGNEVALWPFKHTLEELKAMNSRNPLVFGRQYMQNPQPKEGLLYSTFKTYTVAPATKRKTRKAYIDTADTGSDYLCSIVYDETEIGLYVVDILYTQAPMETTEPETATQLTKHKVSVARIESNNGGRGFARNVESQMRILKNHGTRVSWFHQSDSKEVRIFTRSAEVTNMIYMPANWDKLWPTFYKHVTSYAATGKNAHDDAQDTLTGMVEHIGKNMPTDPAVLQMLIR